MNPERLDQSTWAFYLEVPTSKVVLLQALFELYEGLGTVRTLDLKSSLVCVMTSEVLLAECAAALQAISTEIPWRFASRPVSMRIDKLGNDYSGEG